MELQEEKTKKINTYVMTAIVICVLFLVLCALKKIYPFGTATIDTIDFGSQWVPAYYHVWDFLHGEGSLLFDWKVAGGMDLSGAASQFVLLSPFNLLLFLVKRNQIQQFMTFFILIKLVVMGISMNFFLQKQSRKVWGESSLIVAGSVAYALSGYTFHYYGMGWPDVAAVFPVLIYNLLKMVRKEKGWKPGRYAIGYTICLTIIFVISIPQAYMVCLFLILFAGGYFFVDREGEKINKEGILKFGLTSLLSLGLSAVVFLPAALGILHSYRMSGGEYTGENGYFWLLRQGGMDPQIKWGMLLGVILPFFYLIVTTRKKRKCLWQSYLVIMMVIPVFVEAVNLVWHKGTYMCFPMRHGYMMIFAILSMAFERYQKRQEESQQERKKRCFLMGASFAVWGVLIFGIGKTAMFSNTHDGNEVDFVRDAQEIGAVLAEESDVFHKVKIADASLDSNFPLIAGVSSYTNNLHILTAEQINALRGLGYSQIWTRLSSTGGTLFTDALLGYQYTVNHRQSGNADIMETEYYEDGKDTEHFHILKNKYVYGTGLRIDLESYRQFNQAATGYVFENQNALSEMLFGEDFFVTWNETFTDEKVNETLTYQIPVEREGVLYLYSKEFSGAEIFVNGEKLPVPSYENLHGTRYLSEHNNGILTLGCFENETVEVEIHQTCYDTGIPKEIQFGILDMDIFTDSVAQSRKDAVAYELGNDWCKITATAEQEELLLLPINADGGWQCTINGKEEGMARIYGNVTLVQLKPGENEIVLKHTSNGFKKGMAVTLLAFVLLAIWGGLTKIKSADKVLGKVYDVFSYVALGVFFLVFIGFLIVVYVIPIGYTIYLKLSSFLSI